MSTTEEEMRAVIRAKFQRLSDALKANEEEREHLTEDLIRLQENCDHKKALVRTVTRYCEGGCTGYNERTLCNLCGVRVVHWDVKPEDVIEEHSVSL